MYLFCSPSAVSDFSAVYRIFQYSADKSRVKQRIFSILPLDFMNAVIGKIFCESVCPHIGMHILIKYHTDCFRFFLIDEKLSLIQLIAIWSKAAVPFALTGLLNSALHGLDTDVFSLNLRNG